jgi:large subunit ribosomal protein L23
MSAFWKKDKEKKKESVQDGSEGVKNDSKEKTVSKTERTEGKKGLKKVKKEKKGKDKNTLVIPEEKALLIEKVLVKPMISEAVMIAQELGKYTFRVTKKSTKKEIALAVEALYKVSVEKVNIVNYKAQTKLFRGRKGLRKGYKKAIVTLKKGDKIKLFS